MFLTEQRNLGRVLPVEYVPKKIEYVGRVPGRIPAMDGEIINLEEL